MNLKETEDELKKIIYINRLSLIVPAFVIGLISGALLTSLILLV